MEKNILSYDLIVSILKEFVVNHFGKCVHPDICDKGAAAIEALLSENKNLKSLLVGTCISCQHRNQNGPDSPCWSCFWNPREDAMGLNDCWAWRTDLESPPQFLREPLKPEDLHGMAKKPYWHVGLRPESAPPHWAILPDNVAKYPQDYHYGEYWLAYLQETEEKEKESENENSDD